MRERIFPLSSSTSHVLLRQLSSLVMDPCRFDMGCWRPLCPFRRAARWPHCVGALPLSLSLISSQTCSLLSLLMDACRYGSGCWRPLCPYGHSGGPSSPLGCHPEPPGGTGGGALRARHGADRRCASAARRTRSALWWSWVFLARSRRHSQRRRYSGLKVCW